MNVWSGMTGQSPYRDSLSNGTFLARAVDAACGTCCRVLASLFCFIVTHAYLRQCVTMLASLSRINTSDNAPRFSWCHSLWHPKHNRHCHFVFPFRLVTERQLPNRVVRLINSVGVTIHRYRFSIAYYADVRFAHTFHGVMSAAQPCTNRREPTEP